MNARELQDLLRDVLEELLLSRDDADDPLFDLAERTDGIRKICSFDDVGVLTTDKGLVIECDDGTEWVGSGVLPGDGRAQRVALLIRPTLSPQLTAGVFPSAMIPDAWA